MQACGVTGVTAVTRVMLVGRALSWGMVSLGMPPFFSHVTANSRSDACWWLLGLLRLPHMLYGYYFAGIGLFYAIPAK